MIGRSLRIDQTTRAAFERLLAIARSDTGQARRVANFVLAWWNADVHGGFDLADLFSLDRAIVADMAVIFAFLARSSDAVYPHEYDREIEGIIREWRPEAFARSLAVT